MLQMSPKITQLEVTVEGNQKAGVQGSPAAIPRILHRVMIPRADGNISCSDKMGEARADFYTHNSGWVEYIWGRDAIDALIEKSKALFAEDPSISDFPDLFQKMDEWMYQQDSIRHLIMYHFGGLYMDLDMDCQVDVSDFVVDGRLNIRTRGKTNFLAVPPHHEFFIRMMQRIGDTFREGLDPDHEKRPDATKLTGEHQICDTLHDTFRVDCYSSVADSESLMFIGEEHIKSTGRGEAPCAHLALASWGPPWRKWQTGDRDNRYMASEVLPEEKLAESCKVLYDERTTWGSALLNIVKALS